MLLKNLPWKLAIWIIPFRLFLDFFAALYFGYKEGWKHFWAVFRAHISFYIHAKDAIKLRSKSQKSNYYHSNYIVFRHFLCKKD